MRREGASLRSLCAPDPVAMEIVELRQPGSSSGDEPTRVAAAVIAYRGWPLVSECITSLLQQEVRISPLIVVDNGSGDDSPRSVQAAFPDVQIIWEYPNRGYGAGLNAGLRALMRTNQPYVLLAAHDVLVAPSALGHLVAALDEDPTAAAAAPMVGLRDSPRRVFQVGGHIDLRTWDLVSDHPPGLANADMTTIRATPPRPVDWVDGSIILLRRSMIPTFGEFDERYFVYFEDSDLHLRIRRAGWRILAVPEAFAWQDPGRHNVRLYTRNRLWFVERHAPRRVLLRELVRTLFHASRDVPSRKDEARARLQGAADYLRRRVGAPV